MAIAFLLHSAEEMIRRFPRRLCRNERVTSVIRAIARPAVLRLPKEASGRGLAYVVVRARTAEMCGANAFGGAVAYCKVERHWRSSTVVNGAG
jgi:hypothetical protein